MCSLGAGLSAAYLAYHTKLIVGGKDQKHQLDVNDYIFGALVLYNDIISLFIFILRLLGDRDRSK